VTSKRVRVTGRRPFTATVIDGGQSDPLAALEARLAEAQAAGDMATVKVLAEACAAELARRTAAPSDKAPDREPKPLPGAAWRCLRLLQKATADRALTHAGLKTFTAILAHVNRHTGEARPSYKTLANETGLDRVTVVQAVKHLTHRRWMEVIKGHGRTRTNRYWPAFHRLDDGSGKGCQATQPFPPSSPAGKGNRAEQPFRAGKGCVATQPELEKQEPKGWKQESASASAARSVSSGDDDGEAADPILAGTETGQMIRQWNQFADHFQLQPVTKITPRLQSLLNRFWYECRAGDDPPLGYFQFLLWAASQQGWLLGRGSKKAGPGALPLTLFWLLNTDNHVKVAEGEYLSFEQKDEGGIGPLFKAWVRAGKICPWEEQ
jgi:hypothetical protein